MKKLAFKYATPFITGMFLVSLISGVALFLHFGSSLFNRMHEWLSMILIVPFALHLWKNWRSFTGYFSRIPMIIALAASMMASAAFAVPAMMADREPPLQRLIFKAIENGTVAQIAPLFGHDPDTLTAALQAEGLAVESSSDSISEIAYGSGRNPSAVLRIIANAKR